MNKIRAKGWHFQFLSLQFNLNLLIEMTPTSELRNKLTEINIAVMKLEDFDKTQKEVL